MLILFEPDDDELRNPPTCDALLSKLENICIRTVYVSKKFYIVFISIFSNKSYFNIMSYTKYQSLTTIYDYFRTLQESLSLFLFALYFVCPTDMTSKYAAVNI
jgi:hypothetical protein